MDAGDDESIVSPLRAGDTIIRRMENIRLLSLFNCDLNAYTVDTNNLALIAMKSN